MLHRDVWRDAVYPVGHVSYTRARMKAKHVFKTYEKQPLRHIEMEKIERIK